MSEKVRTARSEASKAPSVRGPEAPRPPPAYDLSPTAVNASLQGGSPLPRTTREHMEASFGRCFADVRVHADAKGASVADRHAADALTVGRNVAFAPGRYRPGTTTGDHLIAHELAHVVQQSGGGGRVAAQARSVGSPPSDPAEVAADRAADAVISGRPVGLSLSGLSTRGRIMRRARLGAKPLPAMSLSSPVPGFGARASAARGQPSPAASAALSPAGNQLPARIGATPTSGAAGTRPRTPRARDAKAPAAAPVPTALKTPDEAQTPIAKDEAAPPDVATAGAPAGAARDGAARGAAPGEGGKEDKAKPDAEKAKKTKEDEKKAEEGEEAKKKKGPGTEEAEGKTKRKKRKFGQVKGSRGGGAAKAALRRLDEKKQAMQHHEPAAQRVGDARAAAVPPAMEGQSRAQGAQVSRVAGAEPPPPEPERTRTQMRGAVADAAPSDMEEMGRMGSGGASARISQTLTGMIGEQVQGVRGTLDQVNTPPPAAEPAPPVPQPAPEPAPGAPAPGLAAAAPPPVPDETLDASEFSEEAEGELAQYDVDEETLAKAEEGPLNAIANDKKDLDAKVEEAGARARGEEAQALTEARGALESQEADATSAMGAGRESGQTQVSGEQDSTRAGEEGGRQTVTDQIQGIYNRTAERVNEKLNGLTANATQRFDTSQQRFLDAFNRVTRAELETFKDDRYSGALGWARWLKDRFVSINELAPVKRIYQRNRDTYIAKIDQLIAVISAQVEQTIKDSKRILEDAKTEIQDLVESLPQNLQAEAQAAQERVAQQFAQLERRVEQAAESARDALAERRKAAIEAVDRALEKIQQENEALLDKIANAIKALAEALGKFLVLMTRITRMGIGSFLSAAAGQALDGMKNHLWGALQQAFKEWIFRKIPFLEPLLNLPPNWLEMLTGLAMSLPGLFMENLPAMLPSIGVAAMIWLATNLAVKLIPGAGAIMAVIDGIRAAWGLVRSLMSAAAAFFSFVKKVAQPANGAADFALALARGIVAGLDALLTFLGVDRLIKRVGGAIARPFGRIFGRIARAFRGRRRRRRTQRRQRRDRDRTDRQRQRERPGDAGRRRRERGRARRDRRRRGQRRRQRQRQRDRNQRREDPRKRRREDPAARRRRERQERERRRRERLNRAVNAIRPRADSLLRRGVSRLRLRAQLALWRVRHRIRRLNLVPPSGGRSAKIVASNSPPRDVTRIFRENPDGIYRMVLDIARTRFRSARKSQAERAESDLGSGGAQPARPSIGRGDDPLELAAGLQARPRGAIPGPGKPVELGVGIGDATVFGKQGRGGSQRAFNNIIISGLGRYPEITRKLASKGLSGPALASAVTSTLRTGQGPLDVKRFIAVLFGAEPARLDIAAATSPLAVSALGGGASSERILGDPSGGRVPGDVFPSERLDPDLKTKGGTTRSGGGDYPQSAKHAAATGRRTVARVEGGQSFREDTNIARRSEADVLRTVELVYQAVRMMDFKDLAGLRREILTLLNKFDQAIGIG